MSYARLKDAICFSLYRGPVSMRLIDGFRCYDLRWGFWRQDLCDWLDELLITPKIVNPGHALSAQPQDYEFGKLAQRVGKYGGRLAGLIVEALTEAFSQPHYYWELFARLQQGADWPGATRKKMVACPFCNGLRYIDGPQRFHCDHEYEAYLKHKEQQHQ